MEENSEFDAEFRVRLPSALAEQIAQLAQKERRSRNSQYVYMLENWFELKAKIDNLAEGSSVDRGKTAENMAAAG
jgi:predicted transcriptional regulator